MDLSGMQAYVNNFRRRIARRLLPGFGLRSTIYPTPEGGAVLVFHPGKGIQNDDEYMQLQPVAKTLADLKQHAFGGNLQGFRFHGTNTVLEPDRIILIKDDSPAVWTDEAAQEDVQRILERSRK